MASPAVYFLFVFAVLIVSGLAQDYQHDKDVRDFNIGTENAHIYSRRLQSTANYTFSGSINNITVPNGVATMTVILLGGRGGSLIDCTGGKGGKVTATIPVTPGTTYHLFVGGKGLDHNSPSGGTGGGWNGGGHAGRTFGTAGGGATDIRIGGVALENRILVAGGGGGCANYCFPFGNGGYGGAPGGYGGAVGCGGGFGTGGTSTAGGAKGCWTYNMYTPCGYDGQLGFGGSGSIESYSIGSDYFGGGGGGGGYYGGGGGSVSGGGGGSSWSVMNDAEFDNGVNDDHGYAIITYLYTPTNTPTSAPSHSSPPTGSPTSISSMFPSSQPSCMPSGIPSISPSSQPSNTPSTIPTVVPSVIPSNIPSSQPSVLPTTIPSVTPSDQPSSIPSREPSNAPSIQPTNSPTVQPSVRPTAQPFINPSVVPSVAPSDQPSSQPSTVLFIVPSTAPSNQPTVLPSIVPSVQPSTDPTNIPSVQPSSDPSAVPSIIPSAQPSSTPSSSPTHTPSAQPSSDPSAFPSIIPSVQPPSTPSSSPTHTPSAQPSSDPSAVPSASPTQPSSAPSSQPSANPSMQPSTQPSIVPSVVPSATPSVRPSSAASGIPSMCPTSQPSVTPSVTLSVQPSSEPSVVPSVAPSSQPTSTPSTVRPKVIISLPFLFHAPITVSEPFDSVFVDGFEHGSGYVFVNGNEHSRLIPVGSVISYDFSGRSVANAGDINGDGYDDLIIGVPYSAIVYVLFGTADGYSETSEGFIIFGVKSADLTGWSVSGAGDVNNDTIADIIIGAPLAEYTGVVYVLYGQRSANVENVHLSEITSNGRGLAVRGAASQDAFGLSVSSAGDCNGDGYGDVAVGALRQSKLNTGAAHIIFGNVSHTTSLSVSQLASTIGQTYTGPTWSWFGYSVSGAGDVNGDNFTEVIIGSSPRRDVVGVPVSYLLYGNQTLPPSGVISAALANGKAVTLTGGGVIVAGVGDVNGDHLDDVLIVGDVDLSTGAGFALSLTVVLPPETVEPSQAPTVKPTFLPTNILSLSPTVLATLLPSVTPSWRPTQPTTTPTAAPSGPTYQPTLTPTQPTSQPSATPTAPTLTPSDSPTMVPSGSPTWKPTVTLTHQPSTVPTAEPTTVVTTRHSTVLPTPLSTRVPTANPSRYPLIVPTRHPSVFALPNNSYTVIYIDTAGTYTTNSTQIQYVVNVSSSEAVQIIGSSGGHCMFTILPQSYSLLRIEGFDKASDVLDLREFTNILSHGNLILTEQPLLPDTMRRLLRTRWAIDASTTVTVTTFHLPRSQVVELKGVTIDELRQAHILYNTVTKGLPSSSDNQTRKKDVISLAIGLSLLIAFVLYAVYNSSRTILTLFGLRKVAVDPISWEEQRKSNRTFVTFLHDDSLNSFELSSSSDSSDSSTELDACPRAIESISAVAQKSFSVPVGDDEVPSPDISLFTDNDSKRSSVDIKHINEVMSDLASIISMSSEHLSNMQSSSPLSIDSAGDLSLNNVVSSDSVNKL